MCEPRAWYLLVKCKKCGGRQPLHRDIGGAASNASTLICISLATLNATSMGLQSLEDESDCHNPYTPDCLAVVGRHYWACGTVVRWRKGNPPAWTKSSYIYVVSSSPFHSCRDRPSIFCVSLMAALLVTPVELVFATARYGGRIQKSLR